VEDAYLKEDGTVWATHLILRTPAGNILQELFSNDISIGVSSRGYGQVRKQGEDEIVEDREFHLETWDFVYVPSVEAARPRPIRTEGNKISTPHNFQKLRVEEIASTKSNDNVSNNYVRQLQQLHYCLNECKDLPIRIRTKSDLDKVTRTIKRLSESLADTPINTNDVYVQFLKAKAAAKLQTLYRLLDTQTRGKGHS